MEQSFNVIQIESLEQNKVVLHGRAIHFLKVGQTVYLDIHCKASAKIVRIVSYNRDFLEIEPGMGCAVTIELPGSNENFPNIEHFW